MKLSLTRLFSQKGSSISASFPVELASGESLVGFQAAAYIKSSVADSKILCVFDAIVNPVKKSVDVSVGLPQTNKIPAGQLVYYVELYRGMGTKIVERNTINIEP